MTPILRLLAAASLLVFASASSAWATPSFSQDTFLIDSQDTLVELSDIDTATSSFMVRTSGSVSNPTQGPTEIFWKDYQTVSIAASDDFSLSKAKFDHN